MPKKIHKATALCYAINTVLRRRTAMTIDPLSQITKIHKHFNFKIKANNSGHGNPPSMGPGKWSVRAFPESCSFNPFHCQWHLLATLSFRTVDSTDECMAQAYSKRIQQEQNASQISPQEYPSDRTIITNPYSNNEVCWGKTKEPEHTKQKYTLNYCLAKSKRPDTT